MMIFGFIFLFALLFVSGGHAQSSCKEKLLHFNLTIDKHLPYAISPVVYESDGLKKDTFKNTYLPLTVSYVDYTSFTKALNKYTDVVYINTLEELQGTNTVLPAFLRFYEDPQHFRFNEQNCQLELIKIDSTILKGKLTPFFIKRFEVTNYEYRQFVNYVRDSIARRILAEDFPEKYLKMPENNEEEKDEGKWDLNWNVPLRYDTEENIPILSRMYFSDGERYYGRREIDSRKLNYTYTKGGKEYNVNVYPDTLAFNSLINVDGNFLSNLYFWHPAYDNYPVVNINWAQANAYCNWLEAKIRKELNQKIKISLPSEFHWELMTAGLLSFENFDWGNKIDNSWETKLSTPVKYAGKDIVEVFDSEEEKFVLIPYKRLNNEDTYLEPNYSYLISSDYFGKNGINNKFLIKKFGNKHAKMLSDFISKSTNKRGIIAINSSVSEWMQDSYQHNWMSVFNTNLAGLKECMVVFYQKEYVNQYYYNLNNYPNGRLVRGGSWMNERDVPYNTGVKEKGFLDPERAYPNVGFRYVITFE